MTAFRDPNHNFSQPDTFELDRSRHRRQHAIAGNATDRNTALGNTALENTALGNASQRWDPTDDDGPYENFYDDYDPRAVPDHVTAVDSHDYDGSPLPDPDVAESNDLSNLVDRADEFVIGLMGKLTLPVVRIGLAIIFFWFGFLKFFDGVSPAQGLVEETVAALGGLFGFESMPTRLILFLLALWEVAIGIGFLINRYRRTVILMLFLQLPGTILPVFLLPSVVWHTFPYGLTLEGQYIVKNLVLVGAALALGSQIRYDEQRARDSLDQDEAYYDDDEMGDVVGPSGDEPSPYSNTAPYSTEPFNNALVSTASYDTVDVDRAGYPPEHDEIDLYSAEPYNAGPYNAEPYNAEPYNAGPYNAEPYNAGPYNAEPYNAEPYATERNNAGPYEIEHGDGGLNPYEIQASNAGENTGQFWLADSAQSSPGLTSHAAATDQQIPAAERIPRPPQPTRKPQPDLAREQEAFDSFWADHTS